MEELTLHYYFKVFSLFIIIILLFICLLIFYFFNKNLILLNNKIDIEQGEIIEKIFNNNITNYSQLDIFLSKIYLKLNNLNKKKFIHHGDFFIDHNISLNNFISVITKPSNVINKITIIEGWSELELNQELSRFFYDYFTIPYEEIIADTYFFNKGKNFEQFYKNLKNLKYKYFIKFKGNKLLEKYSINEIIIIGSLIEKEGLDNEDKKKIASVIFNRLDNKMKLQIDATVIYSLTNGLYNLDRKLLLKDLKFNHPFNTYQIYGLPPKPISYVGKETIDIIFEHSKTDFLFYFFNKSLNKHIFSKNFEEHKIKLNEYRNKK